MSVCTIELHMLPLLWNGIIGIGGTKNTPIQIQSILLYERSRWSDWCWQCEKPASNGWIIEERAAWSLYESVNQPPTRTIFSIQETNLDSLRLPVRLY